MFGMLVFLISISLNLYFIFYKKLKRQLKPNIFILIKHLCISIISCVIIFWFGELFFRTTYIRSDNNNQTLASNLWFMKYWQPKNSLGFRDVEHLQNNQKSKINIFVVGDSFTAGHGIKNYQDRFSDILQRNLGKFINVFNIALKGWNTADEYRGILTQPQKPDMVIVSYYINDIETAAESQGFALPYKQRSQPLFLKLILNNSYFLNFVYWKVQAKNDSASNQSYWSYLDKMYDTGAVLSVHQQEIKKIISFCDTNNIKLYFVLFPSLVQTDQSYLWLDKISQFLDKEKHKYIDLRTYLDKDNIYKYRVSDIDAHPNENLHLLVGNLLTEAVTKEFQFTD